MRVPSGLRRLVPALLLALSVAGCGGGRQVSTLPSLPQPSTQVLPPQAALPPPKKPALGLLLPLTGGSSKLGADFLDAAQLALFDVGQTELELIPRDTGDRPDQAATAAASALDAGADLLLGPLFGRSTTAVGPVAGTRGVSVLSFSNDASVAGPGVYVLGFRPEEQVERVVGYAARQGATRFAALVPANGFGNLVLEAWRRAVGQVPGATAVSVERYEPGGDPSESVRRLASLGGRQVAQEAPAGAIPGQPAAATAPPPSQPPAFDSLLVGDLGPRLRTLAASLAFYDLSTTSTHILGTMPWQDDPTVLSEPTLRGSWLAAPPPQARDAFSQRFRAAYGRTPEPLAVLAYDGTALAALLARGGGGFTPAALTDPQGFSGGSGVFRLRGDGLAEHALAVVEVEGGGTRLLDPAPSGFGGGFAQR